MKTYTLVVEEAILRGTGIGREVMLTFDTQPDLVAELLSVEDAIAYFGHEKLLHRIGSKKANEYFLMDEK